MTCPCAGGKRRKTVKTRKYKGGTVVGDAVLAGTAIGLYSYFKKKGGSKRRFPTRRTRRGY
jgi:hypothetical protein